MIVSFMEPTTLSSINPELRRRSDWRSVTSQATIPLSLCTRLFPRTTIVPSCQSRPWAAARISFAVAQYKKCCLREDEASRAPFAAKDQPKKFSAEPKPKVDEAVDPLLIRLERGEGRGVLGDLKALHSQHPGYHMTNYAVGVYQATVAKDHEAALAFFEKAVQIFPPFPEAHFNLGLAARRCCNVLKAAAAFRVAETYSDYDDGIAGMANEELKHFEEAVTTSPPFKNLDQYLANAELFDRAFQCLRNQDYQQSISLFNRVVGENPEHVSSFGNLALAHAGRGKRSEAIACLDRALALDPDYSPALDNRRVLEHMREGEPFVPEKVLEVEHDRAALERS